MKIFLKILLTFTAVSVILFYSCSELPEGFKSNSAPETYLSLFPDSIISPQKTRIKISWWGDDPDGLVQGYRFSFDSLNWTFTPNNDSTFLLIIVGNDSTFRFWVSAVDNEGNIDPTPATNLYPVYNSPPDVRFNLGTEIPDTTFPVASFAWTGTDPDGDNTIKYYHWALNDTNNWRRIPGNINLITLKLDSGIVPNTNNVFYLKAEDIAGKFSPVRRMPDSTRRWFVRPKTGNILLINDYFRTAPTDVNQAVAFYRNALDSAYLNAYSYLDIKVANGANIPKIINPMFVETLRLFQCVIWFANRGNSPVDNPNFELAQQSLPFYFASGGKIFFSCGFPNTIDAQGSIINFAPVDSVTFYQVTTMPLQTQISWDPSYPILESGSPGPDRVRGIIFRAPAYPVYKIPFNPPYDTARMTVCIKDSQTNPKVVFMSLPLNRVNFNGNATVFLRRIISTEFGITN
ncbi:MAG: hypothetical protein N2510_05355 [Ignavibacteria bacterium]|nr:hypothetical protein [Ignavibacteria bacterium]